MVTKDQMAKTVAKVFYERFIAVFRAPAKLLSDRGSEFHIHPCRGAVLCLWYPEVQDHGLPRTVQRAGGAFPSDTIPHDWQAILQQEGSMGAASTGAPTSLQQHPVGGDQLFAALSDVWEVPASPC